MRPSITTPGARSLRPGAITASVAVAVATLGAATAAADPLPAGRLSFVTGLKNGTGRLANDIGLGYAFGFEAGYAPMGLSRRIGWGLSWGTLWSRYEGGARISGTLSMIELDFGARGRIALGVNRRAVLWLAGGGTILRTNEPFLSDDRRNYVGPFAALGIEGAVGLPEIDWRPIIGLSARYGLIEDDQGTVALLLAIGGGT